MAIPLVTAIIFAFFWTLLANKIGKRSTYIYGALLTIIVLFFTFIIPAGNIPVIALFLFFIGIALSANQIIPMSLLPDIIDIDEYYHHTRREGAFNGIIMFLHKASSGIAVGIVGLLIEWFGYVEAIPGAAMDNIIQPDSALTAIRVILAMLPSIAFLLAIIFAWRLEVSSNRMYTIVDELNKRND